MKNEVDRPDVIPGFRFPANNPTISRTQSTPFDSLFRDLKALLSPKSINALRIYLPAFISQQTSDPSVPKAGKLTAFDISDRESAPQSPSWFASIEPQSQGDGPATPAVDKQRVYIGSGDKFYSFDRAPKEPTEQKPLWVTRVQSPFFVTSPTIANGIVYSAAGNSDLYAFEASTGKLLWTHTVPGASNPIRSKPVVANGRLYHAATFAFKVLAFVPTHPVDPEE
jgi:outer membrane protein assembly factor BamB